MFPLISGRYRLIILIFTVWLLAACQVDFETEPAPEPTLPPLVDIELDPEEHVLVSTPTPGPTPTPTPEPLAEPDAELAAELAAEGDALFMSSDLAEAEDLFIDAIAADPGYLPAHIGLARVYLHQPQYWRQSLEVTERALELAHDDASVLAHRAWAYQAAHHFEDARATASLAVELDPDNALAHAALADVLISMYDVDEAYEHAQRAAALDDQSASVWGAMGSAEFVLHNWDEATVAYDRVLELEPEFFAWSIVRARHELNTTGDVVAAQEIAELALERQPQHAWTLFFQVEVAIENRDWETAEARCVDLMAVNQPHTPYADAFLCMAAVLVRQDRFDEAEHYQAIVEQIATPARRDLTLIRMRLLNERDECGASRALAQDWLDERPYSVQAMRMIGVSYLCDEEYEQAVAYFQQAYEVLPRSVDGIRLLAVANAHAGNASAARTVLNEAAQFAIDNPLYHRALYEVHMILGERRDALRAAQRWQVLRPNDTDARVSIALAQLLLDNVEAALGSAERALEDGESSTTLYAVLGEAYSRAGEAAKAEEFLLRAHQRNPEHYLTRNFLAGFYMARNRCAQALPHLRWLQDQAGEDEEVPGLTEALRFCEERARPRPTPDPAEALADQEAFEEVESIVAAAGAELRQVELAETAGQLSLAVAYTTALTGDSEEFVALEEVLAKGLARLLPRITSQPELLVLLSGSGDEAQGLTVVSVQAVYRWLDGELTDEEFVETWQRQRTVAP